MRLCGIPPRYARAGLSRCVQNPERRQLSLTRLLPAFPRSGFNLRKLEAALAAGRVHARYHKPETFRRLTAPLLARVLLEGGVDCLLLDLRAAADFALCHVASGACMCHNLTRTSDAEKHTPLISRSAKLPC
jgi:hypothetical protein